MLNLLHVKLFAWSSINTCKNESSSRPVWSYTYQMGMVSEDLSCTAAPLALVLPLNRGIVTTVVGMHGDTMLVKLTFLRSHSTCTQEGSVFRQ